MTKAKKFFRYFLISAINITLLLSILSFSANAAVSIPKIKNFKGKAGYTSITLSWGNIKGAKYKIYTYSDKAGDYVEIAYVSSNSYTVEGLKQGTTYSYNVQPCKTIDSKTHYGAFTPTIRVTTKVRKPSKVKNLKATSTPNSIKLTWQKQNNIQYEIYSYNRNTKKYKYIATTKNSFYTINNLRSGKTYYYSIRPFKTIHDGNKYNDYFGEYSKPIEVKTKTSLTLKKARKLYNDASEIYMNWIYSCAYTADKGYIRRNLYGQNCLFAPVEHSTVKSLDDLKKLLSKHFDKSIYEKELYLYAEVRGKLYYYAEGGVGDPSIGIKYCTDSLKKTGNAKYQYILYPKYYKGFENHGPKSYSYSLISRGDSWVFTKSFPACSAPVKSKK